MDFNALLTAELKTQNETRTEWSGELGGTPVTLYAKPLCPADHEYVAKKGYRDFLMNPTLPAMAHMIARKAESENGTKAFRPNADVPLLMKLDQDKLSEVFAGLFGDQLEPETEEGFEDRVGNSGPTTSG